MQNPPLDVFSLVICRSVKATASLFHKQLGITAFAGLQEYVVDKTIKKIFYITLLMEDEIAVTAENTKYIVCL